MGRRQTTIIVDAADADAWAAAMNEPRMLEGGEPNPDAGFGPRTVDVSTMLALSPNDNAPADAYQCGLNVAERDWPRLQEICATHGAEVYTTDTWEGEGRSHTPAFIEVDGEQVRASLKTHRRKRGTKIIGGNAQTTP